MKPISLTTLLRDAAAPASIAAYGGDETPCSAETWQQAVQTLSAQLRRDPAQRWLLWCDDSLQFSIALFALWRAGKTVNLPASVQPEVLRNLCREVDAALADQDLPGIRSWRLVPFNAGGEVAAGELTTGGLSTGELATGELATGKKNAVRQTDGAEKSGGEYVVDVNVVSNNTINNNTISNNGIDHNAASTCVPATADGIALILHTSGSSGDAKAIPRTLTQLDAEIAALEQQFGAALGKARIAATVPHHHIYGLLFRVLWPLCSGRAFLAGSEQYPEPLAALLARHAPVALISSPAHLERLPAVWIGALAVPPVAVFSSAAPLSRAAALAMQACTGTTPVEVLGSTETGGVAFRQRRAGDDDERWTLLPGVQMRLGADGGIEVQSPAAWTADWCALGDRAELCGAELSGTGLPGGDAAGARQFRLLGRVDRLVKLEGKRLSLQAVEQRLQQHPLVVEARALILPAIREQHREQLAVVAVLTPAGADVLRAHGRRHVSEQLKADLLQQFERVLLPRKFRFPPALPVDSRGKCTQAALQSLFDEQI